MFKEIIEAAIPKEEIENKKIITAKINTLIGIMREIGEKWENDAGKNGVYYIYKEPKTGCVSLQIGDIRSNTSFKTILRSVIQDKKNVFAYVFDKDLQDYEQVVETVEKEQNSSLKNLAITINSPLKEVINAVKKSTEKSIEAEITEKKERKKEKEADIAKKVEDDVNNTNSPIKDLPETLISSKKVFITEHSIIDDLEPLIEYDENVKQIQSIVKFLMDDNESMTVEAQKDRARGYLSFPVADCLQIFKGMNEPETKLYKFYKYDKHIINIANVMFSIKFPGEGKGYMYSVKEKIYSPNCFR